MKTHEELATKVIKEMVRTGYCSDITDNKDKDTLRTYCNFYGHRLCPQTCYYSKMRERRERYDKNKQVVDCRNTRRIYKNLDKLNQMCLDDE